MCSPINGAHSAQRTEIEEELLDFETTIGPGVTDEVFLKIFSYLDIRDLLSTHHCCRSFRQISADESLLKDLQFPFAPRQGGLKSGILSQACLHQFKTGSISSFRLEGPGISFNGVAATDAVIASGRDDHTVCVWDRKTFKPLASLEGHTDCINAVAATDALIVSGASDKTVRVWDRKTFDHLNTLTEHTGPVNAVAATDEIIVSGADDKTVRVWDRKTFDPLKTLTGHKSLVKAVAATDEILVSGANDKTVRIWDRKTYELLATLDGHTAPVIAVAANDEIIAAGSYDKTVRVWDRKTLAPMKTLIGHTGPVKAVAIAGRLIISSSSSDKTLQIWDSMSGESIGKWTTLHTRGIALSQSAIIGIPLYGSPTVFDLRPKDLRDSASDERSSSF
ncbi:MAG: hypothetical protein K0S07_1217 [Chlamydiales bacterium]|jgi:WD40 repeat protein|nr:hypothetical protein [Chlamydiales bacterium]